MSSSHHYIGVDVSKHFLDVAGLGPRPERIGNTRQAVAGFVRRLARVPQVHLVCEATGTYTRLLSRELSLQHVPYSRVNPRQIRSFARANGQLAKTDAIDASQILRFAEVMNPPVSRPLEPMQEKLKDLVLRRRQLVDMLAKEKQRMEHPDATLRASLERHQAFLRSEIKDLETAIAQEIDGSTDLSHRAGLLKTIPGIGAVTAAVLVAALPELGHTGNKQIAALAGVAPLNRDSGCKRGQAHIAGGRKDVRCALYMAAVSAIRCNPPIKQFYRRLRDDGKPAKVAIVAAMHKLIIVANTILQNNTPWTLPET